MRQQINKFMFVALVLSAGIVGGLVVSGRMSLTSPSVANQTPPQTRPATAVAAAAALPDLSSVAEQALRASVNITSTVVEQVNDPMYRLFYGRNPAMRRQSAGSGVIVSSDGYVLTNNHVIGNSGGADVKVTLPDGSERVGKLIGVDGVSDLAVVKVDAKNLETLPWGDSDKLRVAEWVLAVGNPFQLSGTVTLGIVSTKSRSGAQVGQYGDFIQTDAAINPGNSGGALINGRGELIGINTMILPAEGGSNLGIGFAIPSNLARQIMSELINNQNHEIVRGTVGIIDLRKIDANAAAQLGLGSVRGVMIYDMYRRSSAYRSGLQLGDIITKVDDQDITDANQFQRLVYNAKIGSTLKITVSRDGRSAVVNVPVEKLTGG